MSCESLIVDNDMMAMSILNTHTGSDDHFNLFGERTETSFVKRDTRYFKVTPTETKKVKRGFREFCTGSSYIGEWNLFGFCGQGTYMYPHGVEYEGRFNKQGQFHGLGTLTYPNGQRMHGVWKHGKLFEYAYMFNCGEELDENFTYCQMPDRRFHVEVQKYFGPSGQEFLTADQPIKELPSGCYDTVYGIYNPKHKYIMTHEYYLSDLPTYTLAPQIESCRRKLTDEFTMNERIIIEIPTEEKIRWIKENCRKAWDEPTGFRPDLFENWNAGRRKDPQYYDDTKTAMLSRMMHSKPKESPKLFSFIKKVKKPHLGRFSVFSNK